VNESIQRIRDFINKPRRQYLLLKDPASWSQCCSCLDVIEDSELAIAAYSAGEFGASDGARYLAVYGLLQALFLQQHAIDNLCRSLGIPDTIYKYPRLKDIREIRNMSIGHPTKRERNGNSKKGELPSYHFISRPTLSINGFTLLSDYADGTSKSKDVSAPDLIADQKKYLSGIINTVKDNLEKQEGAHKERFRMEKLVSVFPGTLNYHLGKILLAAGMEQDAVLGQVNLQQVKDTLQSFRQALEKRGIEPDTHDSIKYAYEQLQYPLAKLEEFFQSVKSGSQPNIDEEAAYIFAFFVQEKVAELRQMAQEIDQDYSG
jgi:hypothetical protein